MFTIKDDKNEFIGGITANTRFATVYIDHVFIKDEFRNKGLGKKLFEMVESKAIEYGCRFAALGTFESFGVKSFYEKLGYNIVSKTVDSPKGQTGYWFYKAF